MTDGFDLIEKLYELSPHLMLVLFINFVLWGLKLAPGVPNWTLPFIAMSIGTILYPSVAEVGKMSYNVHSPQMFLHLFGAALGGMSVCLNQIFRQMMKRFGLHSGDTDSIQKPKGYKSKLPRHHHDGFPVP